MTKHIETWSPTTEGTRTHLTQGSNGVSPAKALARGGWSPQARAPTPAGRGHKRGCLGSAQHERPPRDYSVRAACRDHCCFASLSTE